MTKRAVIKAHGLVIGVFFRAYVSKKAEELELVGSVNNETDGTVKIISEGEEENLKKLIEYCKVGPKFAKVDRVEVEWEEASGAFNKFEII